MDTAGRQDAGAHDRAPILENRSAGRVRLRLLPAGRDVLDREGIVREVLDRAGTSPGASALASAAWSLVAELSLHDHPVQPGPWRSGLSRYIGSAGRGHCDDHAVLLGQVWEAVGLTARVWNLDGHVVPEVLVDGRWEVHDPDLEVRYRRGGVIVGVHDLRRDPSLVIWPQQLVFHGGTAHALFSRYATQIADAYRSATPDQVRPVPIWNPGIDDGILELAPGAQVSRGDDAEGRAVVVVADPVGAAPSRLPFVPTGRSPAGSTGEVVSHEYFVADDVFTDRLVLSPHPPAVVFRPLPPTPPRPSVLHFDLPELGSRLETYRRRHGPGTVDLRSRDAVETAARAAGGAAGPTIVLLTEVARLMAAASGPVSWPVAPVPLVSMALMAQAGRSDEVVRAVAHALGLPEGLEPGAAAGPGGGRPRTVATLLGPLGIRSRSGRGRRRSGG